MFSAENAGAVVRCEPPIALQQWLKIKVSAYVASGAAKMVGLGYGCVACGGPALLAVGRDAERRDHNREPLSNLHTLLACEQQGC